MEKNGKKIRAADVAALAQSSRSTVSRALAGDKRISKAVTDRILAAAKELSYEPNLIARSLKNQRTGIVGVVVTDLDIPYHADTLKLLIDEMGDRQLAPLVFACNTPLLANAVISRLMNYQVDGVIALAGPFSSEIVRSCHANGKPLVLMNPYDGPEQVNIVAGDNFAGGALAADHLVNRGARRFAFLAGEDGTPISKEREFGFSTRLKELGHSSFRRVSCPYSYDAAFKASEGILTDSPDAVFCANDTLAFALMDAARQRFGRSVPEDIMVVGYDNSRIAGWPSYDLTSIDQSRDQLALQAVTTLMAVISGASSESIKNIIGPRLIERGSTSPSHKI